MPDRQDGIADVEPLKRFRAALEADGWTVEAGDIHEDWWSVSVDHPLSNHSGFSGPMGRKDKSDRFIERCLKSREFRTITERPEIVHEALIGQIRRAALTNSFDRRVVAIFARILRDQQLLTDEEAEWLEDAGPAWVETEPEE